MKKTIIFDVDGTLVNTHDGIIHTIEEVLETYGLSYDGDYDLWIGPPVKNSFMKFFGFSEERAEETTRFYRKLYIDKYIIESYLYPGIRETLKELKQRNFRLAVATMKTAPQVDKLFSFLGIQHFFEKVKTAREDGSLSKAQMISDLEEGYDEVYMIGDTDGDRVAAVAVGCHFIGVTYGFGYHRGEKYDFTTADSPADILTMFK